MTSFSGFFDERKCEGCRDGMLVHDIETGDYMNCPSPCPRRNDVEYVYEQFNNWLDNIDTKLSRDNYMNMGVAMEASHVITDGYVSWISFDGSKYSDMAEQFWNWIDKNKSIFTADDYFEMGGAI